MHDEHTVKRAGARFANSLRILVEATYCLGAASADEYRLAYIDYFAGLTEQIIGEIQGKCKLPPYRNT